MKYIILFCLISTPALADDMQDYWQRAEQDEQQTQMQERLDEIQNEMPDSQPQYAAPESSEPGYGATQYVPAIDPNPPVNVVGGQTLGE